MDFLSLPIEIQQHIFSYLPVKTLLQLSIVCTSWKLALEQLIIRRVRLNTSKHYYRDILNEINPHRRYRSVSIDFCAGFDKEFSVEQILQFCIDNLRPRQLYLYGVPNFQLERVFKNSEWLQDLEELCITLRDRTLKVCTTGQVAVELPKLIRFQWFKDIKNSKSNVTWSEFTMNTPNLETVLVEHQPDDHQRSVFKFCSCAKLRKIDGIFSVELLDNIFGNSLSNLKELVLYYDQMCNYESFFQELKQLRRLTLQTLSNGSNSPTILNAILQCTMLEELIMKPPPFDSYQALDFYPLSKTTANLRALEVNTSLIHNELLEFPALEYVKLTEAVRKQLKLSAPSLRIVVTSSVDLQFLTICHPTSVRCLYISFRALSASCIENIQNLQNLTVLYLKIESSLVTSSLIQFLSQFECLKDLTIRKSNLSAQPDRNLKADSFMTLERLHLEGLFLNLDLFYHLSKSSNLKILVVVFCEIKVKQQDPPVYFHQLQKFHIRELWLAWDDPRANVDKLPIETKWPQLPIEVRLPRGTPSRHMKRRIFHMQPKVRQHPDFYKSFAIAELDNFNKAWLRPLCNK